MKFENHWITLKEEGFWFGSGTREGAVGNLGQAWKGASHTEGSGQSPRWVEKGCTQGRCKINSTYFEITHRIGLAPEKRGGKSSSFSSSSFLHLYLSGLSQVPSGLKVLLGTNHRKESPGVFPDILHTQYIPVCDFPGEATIESSRQYIVWMVPLISDFDTCYPTLIENPWL